MTDNNNCEIPKGIFGLLRRHKEATDFMIRCVSIAIAIGTVIGIIHSFGYLVRHVQPIIPCKYESTQLD